MADEPKPQSTFDAKSGAGRPSAGRPGDAPDRTGLLVAMGIMALAVLGVGTVFAEPIMAALSPGASATAEPSRAEAPATPAPATPAPGGAAAVQVKTDGGG